MKSQYKNTIFVSLLLCLLITFASASSFIQQVTDDFNTSPQQDGEEAKQISSSENKVSVSATMTGLSNRVPSSYSITMESFNTLLESGTDRHLARPFLAGGYNWTLIVYPKGNKNDKGSGYISLYVAIDNKAFATADKDVYADLKFYVLNNKEKKYFTIQANDLWQFNKAKTMNGFSQVMLVDTFKDPKNGYLSNGHCEFGVDVIVPSRFQSSELLTIAKSFPDPTFTWALRRYSTLENKGYYSDHFTVGGRDFYLLVYPNGYGGGEGKYFSMYIYLAAKQRVGIYEEVYVKGKLRVLNQRNLPNVEKAVDNWFGLVQFGGGQAHFMPLTDLKDPKKGFIVNDMLIVQAELEAISKTTYFP